MLVRQVEMVLRGIIECTDRYFQAVQNTEMERGQPDSAQQNCQSKIFRSTVVLTVRMHLPVYRQLKLPNLDLLYDVCSEQLK